MASVRGDQQAGEQGPPAKQRKVGDAAASGGPAAEGHLACLITGGNRGIGLALAGHCVDSGWSVVCACRSAEGAERELAPLRERLRPGRRLAVVQLDLAGSLEDCERAGRDALAAMEGSGASFEVLFNNAGVTVPTHPYQPITDTRIASKAEMLRVLEVNVVGTLQVCQALAPLLGVRKILNISSRQGSIGLAWQAAEEDGIPEGSGVYGVSKAAQNMMSAQLAICLKKKGVAVAAVSPGWVATDMGHMGGRRPRLTVEESVAGLLSVAKGLTLEQSGQFLNYDGSRLPY